MENKVFLESARSENSINETSNISVHFDVKSELNTRNDISETFSLFQQYTDEKDACNKYRLIFVINPVCSNVLFNRKTEVIYKNDVSGERTVLLDYVGEGINSNNSGAATFINATDRNINTSSQITRKLAIRNTEYSHPDLQNLTYQCGVDIFNNPILRCSGFAHHASPKISKTAIKPRPWPPRPEPFITDYGFNTISDYDRNCGGGKKYLYVPENKSGATKLKQIEKHVYTTDSLERLIDTFNEKCTQKDGWYGFVNKSNINIVNDKIVTKTKKITLNGAIGGINSLIPIFQEVTYLAGNLSINKAINNASSCSFVDLYPTRKEFSMIPEYNKTFGRLEYNWDYCLVYPAESDKDTFNKVNENDRNAIKVLSAKVTTSAGGNRLLTFKTKINHNLTSGEKVWIYYSNKDKDFYAENSEDLHRYYTQLTVYSTGDEERNNANRYVSIKIAELEDLCYYNGSTILDASDCTSPLYFYIKKADGNDECEYYFRSFKKIKIHKNDEGNESDDLPYSTINKLAFGENIYGDDLAQLMYTDAIDVSGLRDNLGRDVSSIYLMFFKTNRGHKEWYEDNNFRSEKIERSHCFGKLTAGLDLAPEDYNYNVHKLHNINLDEISPEYSTGTNDVFSLFKTQPLPLYGLEEDGILSSGDNFLCDICEFRRSDFKETPIDSVYYRFNTQQRETSNQAYYDIEEDVITFDDYDYMDRVDSGDTDNNVFLVETLKLNEATSLISGNTETLYAGNLAPEGYFYKPHYKITLRELNDHEETIQPYRINYDPQSAKVESAYTIDASITSEYGFENLSCDIVTLTSPIDYGYKIGEMFGLYNMATKENVWGTLHWKSGDTIELQVVSGTIDESQLSAGTYLVSYVRGACPVYAIYSESKQEYVWRRVLAPSELTSTDELYDRPFSNGCIYINNNINLFLKRQDPHGIYYMLNYWENEDGVNVKEKLRVFNKWGFKIDTSRVAYLINDLTELC